MSNDYFHIRNMNPNEINSIYNYLNVIIKHPIFIKSRKSTYLLSYIVKNSISEKAQDIKELTLAIDVFGMSPTFDTSDSSMIRVAVYKLRNKLKTYYDTDGKNDSVRIKIPKGQYRATFDFIRIEEAGSLDKKALKQLIQSKNKPFIFLHFNPLSSFRFNDQFYNDRINIFNRSLLHYLNDYTTIGICYDIKQCDYDLNVAYLEERNVLRIFLSLVDLVSKVVIWNRGIIFEKKNILYMTWVDNITNRLAQQIGSSLGILFKHNIELKDDNKSIPKKILSYIFMPVYTMNSHVLNNSIRYLSSINDHGLNNLCIQGGLSHLYSLSHIIDNPIHLKTLHQSRELYRQVKIFEPNNPLALLGEARVHYIEGNRHKLKEVTEHILNIYGDCSIFTPHAAYYNAMATGEWDKQMSLIQKIIKNNPYHPDFFHIFLFLYEMRRNNPDRALIELRKMPGSYGIPFQILAVALFAKLDKMEEVLLLLRKYKSENPYFELNIELALPIIEGDTKLVKSIEEGLRKISSI